MTGRSNHDHPLDTLRPLAYALLFVGGVFALLAALTFVGVS